VTTAILRPLAEADLIARTRFYRAEGGDGLGERFFDADHVDVVRLLADAQDLPTILADVAHE